MEQQRVVLRFSNGSILKGHSKGFSPGDSVITIVDENAGVQTVNVQDLKAIFYVKTFEGDRSHKENKFFRYPVTLGKRICVRFRDGEVMTGYLEKDFPWKKGFYLGGQAGNGFFVIPVDDESNNSRVFIIATAVLDVTVMG